MTTITTIARRNQPAGQAGTNLDDHAARKAPPFDWSAHLRVHPAAALFPLMSETELKELADDIKTNGLRTPIIGWASGEGQFVLDGRNRLDALALLGLLYETHDHHVGLRRWIGLTGPRPGGRIEDEGSDAWRNFSQGDPYEIALSLNVHRRHLTPEQKRDLIAKVLETQPAKSDRAIARAVKVDHKTVAAVRSGKEGRGEIPHVEKRKDSKGRKQPAKKPRPAKCVSPAEPMVEQTKPKPQTTGKRTTHTALIEAWLNTPPADRTRAIDAIGLNACLSAMPESWWPLIEQWLADRRQPPAPKVVVDHHLPTDGAIPPSLRRTVVDAAKVEPVGLATETMLRAFNDSGAAP